MKRVIQKIIIQVIIIYIQKQMNHIKFQKKKNIYQEIVDKYNETCTSLPKQSKITDKHKKAIKRLYYHTLYNLKKSAEEAIYIKMSEQYRIKINKADNIRDIAILGIECIAKMTGDKVFERENMRKLVAFSDE
ncbi:hypothetical protein [Vallitalea guaymasensis]|uniref:hypothetical protein n=1 Tax=Vallitalea guaymasensis TaxID=1185412 RepID=UPI00128FF5A1|nr:hypothetical protein [Vallitalea guaymasensis]